MGVIVATLLSKNQLIGAGQQNQSTKSVATAAGTAIMGAARRGLFSRDLEHDGLIDLVHQSVHCVLCFIQCHKGRILNNRIDTLYQAIIENPFSCGG